jgi:tetratricopeptide (TPR) repeat protein
MPILNRIYWILSHPGGRGHGSEGLLARVLPMVNQYADLYLLSEDLRDDWDHLVRVLEMVRVHLEQWGFCRLTLRPVHPVRPGTARGLQEVYGLILQWGKAFFQEAMRHQVVSRWMVLPVLRARSESELEEALALAHFLRERMMVPSLCLAPMAGLREKVERVDTSRERVLMEDGQGTLESLALHDLFDDLLQWSLSSAGGFSLRPCPSLVVDTTREKLRRCPGQDERAYPELMRALEDRDAGEGCLACWHALPERIREALQWNSRAHEGDRVRHQLGVFAFSRRDLRHAEQHFQSISSNSSSQDLRGESLLYLGILHHQKGDIDAAYAALTEARNLMPDSSAVRYHLARCQFAWQDYIAAADLFREALGLGIPGEIETDLRLYLGISHIHLEEFDEALGTLEAAAEDLPAIRFYRAMALLGMGRLEEALDGFRAALLQGPRQEDVASVHFYIAHCLKEMDRWEEAIPHLRMALESDPESYEAWNLLGYCFFRLRQHRDAIGAFLKALKVSPSSAIDYANIGSNLRDLGNLREAMTWYRKALQLDPTLAFAAQNLERLEKMMRET